tara:strand:- start:3800 stop:5113 length:1314 start_codon:yes stop_codon:yes gene_type:complete
MKRLASEVIRDLEIRIARLESTASPRPYLDHLDRANQSYSHAKYVGVVASAVQSMSDRLRGIVDFRVSRHRSSVAPDSISFDTVKDVCTALRSLGIRCSKQQVLTGDGLEFTYKGLPFYAERATSVYSKNEGPFIISVEMEDFDNPMSHLVNEDAEYDFSSGDFEGYSPRPYERPFKKRRRFARTLSPSQVEQEFENAGRLSNVDSDIAKHLVEAGDRKRDKIEVRKTRAEARKLKPSQTTMVLGKSVGMALAMLDGKLTTDLGAIISSDGQIMDGHHRWSAAMIAFGPKVKVEGYVADLEGKTLLKVLNIITKGLFPTRNGNPGKGDISRYTDQAVMNEVKNLAINGNNFNSAEKIQSILIKSFGSVEEGIQQMGKNVRAMNKQVPSWAPDREDMPVINPEEVPRAQNLMSEGEVEWKAPLREIKLARRRHRRDYL